MSQQQGKTPIATILFKENEIKISLANWANVPLTKLERAYLLLLKEARRVGRQNARG